MYNDYDEEDSDKFSEEGYDNDDSDNESDDDALLNHGVDNSAKEEKKDEDGNENLDEDEDEEVEYIVEKEKKSKSRFKSGINKISAFEETRIISFVASALKDSKVTIPEEYSELLKCSSGDCITIAKEWLKHRNIIKLPVDLFRGYHGYKNEMININEIKTANELGFQDLDEEDNYYDTCFRKNGYTNIYSS